MADVASERATKDFNEAISVLGAGLEVCGAALELADLVGAALVFDGDAVLLGFDASLPHPATETPMAMVAATTPKVMLDLLCFLMLSSIPLHVWMRDLSQSSIQRRYLGDRSTDEAWRLVKGTQINDINA